MQKYLTVVFDQDTSRILVMKTDDGKIFIPLLDCREVPSNGYKMTEWCQAELEDYIDTSFDLVFLYSTINETFHRHIPPLYVAMFESRKPVTINPEYESFMWLDIRHMGPERFPNLSDRLALPFVRRIWEECSEKGVRPWEKPGWLQTTTEVATAKLRRLGYEVQSAFQQCRVAPNSLILTVQTDKGLVYLKASNKREGMITKCISDIEPKLARKPLYVDKEREWMLMEDYGQSLENRMSRMDFENVKELLGGLQRKAESEIQRFIDGGIPRVDPGDIVRRVKKMLKDVFLCGDLETVLRNAEKPEAVERFDEDAIRGHCRNVEALLKHLYEDQKIPLTIVHGDMGDYNILKNGTEKDSYVFIDWETARIDLPLLNVDCLPTQIVPYAEKAGASEDSYLQYWAEYGSMEELEELRMCLDLKFCLVGLLEVYDYAVDKDLRPYLEKFELTRLCDALHEIAETIKKLERS